MNIIELALILFLTSVLIMAAVYDIRFKKIPNLLTYPTAGAAIAYHTVLHGYGGLLFSMEGIGLGIAILIFPYLMGGMGAGDVKLMGAVGGLLGPKGVFMAFLFTAIIGGIYSLVLLFFHGYLKEILKRYVTMLKTGIFTGNIVFISSDKKGTKPRLRYGVVIAFGTLISVLIGNAL